MGPDACAIETLTSSLPDVDRHFFNGGVGVNVGNFTIDAAVSYLHAG